MDLVEFWLENCNKVAFIGYSQQEVAYLDETLTLIVEEFSQE